MRRHAKRWGASLLLFGLATCGGNSGLTDLDASLPSGTMSASVDGVAWSAIEVQAVRAGGVVTIAGSDLALLAVAFAFQGVAGTYALGPGHAATASVSDPSNIWAANDLQGSGTITVTTLTATRTAGTFSFTAPASPNSGPPATRVVTNGVFDVTF